MKSLLLFVGLLPLSVTMPARETDICMMAQGLYRSGRPVGCGTALKSSWFYNKAFDRCDMFSHPEGCGGVNKFSSKEQCDSACRHVVHDDPNRPRPPKCLLDKDVGFGYPIGSKFFYNQLRGQCEKYKPSLKLGQAKMGVFNGFKTLADCRAACPVG